MEELLTPKEAGKLLGVSTRTIQRWDKEGLIKVVRTPKGRRRIPKSEVLRILREKFNDRRAVVYARVSSQKQEKDGNLKRQKERLLKFAKEHNYEVVGVFQDVASGINDRRKNFWKMMEFVKKEGIPYVIVEFPDRLTRFGIKFVEKLLEEYGTRLVVAEKKMPKDKMEELVEDLITIITSFTARIYGARSQKFKKVKELLEADLEGNKDCSA